MSAGLYLKRPDSARFYLGPEGAGTTFTDREFKPWFPLGALPVGSILKSVSADVRIDSTEADSWASDMTFVLYTVSDALLQIGGYLDITGIINRVYWTTAGDGGPPTHFTDRKLAGVDFPEGIDLHDTAIYIANGYTDVGSWSGTIDFTFVPT
jgi:hypothetical protein